ncbi:UDP-glycosyltransferase [Datura stramonium]|uniref:UDP-glycosyltransferase n=1 Tax=Datura stramonium TaxID=4076 RepID=A0ABS8UK33_DATST|nr:UDP-glycosyltransferase [Datura stramonium]
MADGQFCTSRVQPGQDPMECKIDKLHNELLLAILSYLSMKEAAKTCLVMARSQRMFNYPDNFPILDNLRELELDLELKAGCTSNFDLALHLLEIEGFLEKIILQPTYDSLLHLKIRQMVLIKKQIKQLEAELPPGVQLVML